MMGLLRSTIKLHLIQVGYDCLEVLKLLNKNDFDITEISFFIGVGFGQSFFFPSLLVSQHLGSPPYVKGLERDNFFYIVLPLS